MNVLFAHYGDFCSNSAIPLMLFARELTRRGHRCVVAMPSGVNQAPRDAPLRAVAFEHALASPEFLFGDGRAADVVHAWTPRENVRRFVTAYLSARPTPWVIYLEDDEGWIARAALALAGLREDVLLHRSEEAISTWTPAALSHVLRFEAFIGLADAAVVTQDQLAAHVPPWVPCTTVMPGVDLAFFSPRPPDPELRRRLGVRDGERVLVYSGGLNDFTRPGFEALCDAVGLVNEAGLACRLLRSDPVSLHFLDKLRPEIAAQVTDLGLPREEMPALYALADLLVQPGTSNPFEEFRLAGKLPELLASGRPVVLPAANIAQLLREGVDAVIYHSGTAEEIAEKCMELLREPERARRIGEGARRFAELHFDSVDQALRLEGVYEAVRKTFDREASAALWRESRGVPVKGLLASKLRQMARSSADASHAWQLAEHAHRLESELKRSRGLETGMTVRGGETAGPKWEDKGQANGLRNAVRAIRQAPHEPQIADALRSRIDVLEAGNADLKESLAESNAGIAALTKDLHEARRTISGRERHIQALESSLSWRITAPLRWVGALFVREPTLPRTFAELAVHPLADDPVPKGDEGGASWVARTFDSAFLAELPPGSLPLARGWYSVRVRIVQLAGQVAGPRIYVPFPHGGYSEARSVELVLRDGVYTGDLYTASPLRELRFDPSIYPCEFECESLHLEPISARGRFWESLRSAWRVTMRLKPSLLSLWFRQGLQVLFTRGPGALLEAAYWAFVNQARARDADYASWVREFATASPEALEAMAAEAKGFARQPTVSFITPVYNTPEPFLRAMIESVLAQAYANWELCLADDASTALHVRKVLAEYAARDSRIRVAWRERNGHISAASNSALALATGDFVALLDHDDAIPPDALYWVVREINAHPDAALLYSDEDKLDFDGERIMPYFKCDWNYDLFLSHNLITHLGVYRTDIVRAIGGFREGFEGAQDYDLALRFIERIKPRQIRHIPRVLYQWRMLRGSTSVGAAEKEYAAERARLAIAEHLLREGIDAAVETIPRMAVQRVRYALPQPPPLVSIVIPTRNGRGLVRQCLESIRAKTTYPRYEIVLVDNGSDEPASLEYFRELREGGVVRLLTDPRSFNFSRLNNGAAREAGGEVLVFLNNDIEVITPDWLVELVSHALRPEIGAVGAKLWYPNDTIQHAGLVLVAGLAGHAHLGRRRGDHGYFGRASLIQALSAVTAACLCIRRDVFEEVGGFDETLAVAFNDVDLCLRVQAAGYRNLYTPYAELYHHESASRGYEDTPEKMRRFQKEADILRARWTPVLMNDPYYNPNLSISGEPFTIAWPPRVEPFRPSTA